MKKIFILNTFLSIFVFAYFVLAIGSGGGGYMPPKSPEAKQKQPQSVEITSTPATKKGIKSSERSARNVICNSLKTISERIRCRLSKTEEELKNEPFMPEECRNLSRTQRNSCLKLYKSFYECFESESDLDSCALKSVGLKGVNPSEWVQECKDKKGEPMNACKKNITNKLLSYLKFYLYHLSYRVEEIKEQNKSKINDIINFIVLVETSKQKLNKANEKEIKSILSIIDKQWNKLTKSLNLPADFNKKSELEELIKKYDTAKSAIQNIR